MIHFVGAGPGDPELMTAKGVRLFRTPMRSSMIGW